MSDLMSLSLLARNFRHSIERVYDPIRKHYKLKQIELEIIYQFENNESVNAVNICSMLDLTKGHVSQAMFDLCIIGYVKAEPCLSDRRLISYKLSESGKELLRVLKTVRANLWNELQFDIDKSDIDIFLSTAAKLTEKMNEIDGAVLADTQAEGDNS